MKAARVAAALAALAVLGPQAVSASGGGTFVVSRNGSEVAATRGGGPFDGKCRDRNDAAEVLASFFVSFLKGGEEWKALVFDFHGSPLGAVLVEEMEGAYGRLYGRMDSISVEISPENFDGETFRLRISLSYRGESEEGEDSAEMRRNGRGEWSVADVPE